MDIYSKIIQNHTKDEIELKGSEFRQEIKKNRVNIYITLIVCCTLEIFVLVMILTNQFTFGDNSSFVRILVVVILSIVLAIQVILSPIFLCQFVRLLKQTDYELGLKAYKKEEEKSTKI